MVRRRPGAKKETRRVAPSGTRRTVATRAKRSGLTLDDAPLSVMPMRDQKRLLVCLPHDLWVVKVEGEESAQHVERGENEVAQLRARLSELEEQITQSQHDSSELKAQIERHDSGIRYNEQRLQELEEQNSRATHEINQAEERQEIARNELAEVTQRLAESEQSLVAHRQTLEQRHGELEKVEAELRDKQSELLKLQSDAFSTAQELTRVRNELNAIEMKRQGNSIRLEKLAAERIQIEEERQRTEERISEFNANFESEKLNIASQRGTVEERQARLREIQQQLNDFQVSLSSSIVQCIPSKLQSPFNNHLQPERKKESQNPIFSIHIHSFVQQSNHSLLVPCLHSLDQVVNRATCFLSTTQTINHSSNNTLKLTMIVSKRCFCQHNKPHDKERLWKQGAGLAGGACSLLLYSCTCCMHVSLSIDT